MFIRQNRIPIVATMLTVLVAMLWLALAGCGGSKEAAQTEIETTEPETIEPEPAAASEVTPPPAPPQEEPRAPEPLILENVYFDYDRYDLTPGTRDILASHARALKNRPEVTVVIEGHCDERGTIEYNLALGEKRARAVMNYLASLGVGTSRLTTISYGKERPVDTRHNEAAWAKNRRAEFVIRTR